nr:DNA-directed DNA polymerase [Tanacetum cinerariifolium]
GIVLKILSFEFVDRDLENLSSSKVTGIVLKILLFEFVDRDLENLSSSKVTRRNKRRTPNVVEPELRIIVEVAQMADNRTMEELLQAPTEGDVPNDVIKLMMFSYSLEGTARVWYDKEPPNSILTWEDLKKLSLPELTPTRMTLELADRSITRPKGVARDVFVKVGKFHFSTDFAVVDFEADPRVPLILGRSFLRTGRALIDVYREEITLRVNDKAVTFNLNQTMRYSSTYDDLSVNRIDIIDVAREEYAQEILGFFNNSSSGNPTLTSEPIISDSSLSLTPFEGSDFILEEIEAYLKDESISPEINHADCDPKRDICLIEKLLNNDPFQLPSMDLKQGEVVKAKSSIEEPSKLELKDLPSHLEYAYLEGVDKLPVIIAKDLKVDEKEALLKVLKSHKWAIAWKITDIKGIDPWFCTYKILMEDDYKPAVQSQRRVNPKIHEVIKKEVIKLLDAGMIYPISDSPWVSPIHCVPKKGEITVVEIENNELISTRLVTGWRVCIDYRKLNDATHKDHFPLPFMDQIHEISKNGLEVDRAKVDVIAKLPLPTTVKGV